MGSSSSRSSRRDRALSALLCSAGALSALILVSIGAFVAREAWTAVATVGVTAWVGDPSWHPTSGRFNLVPMLAGTALSTALAVCLAAPLGLLVATWSLFYAPSWARGPYRAAVGLLAGIPSVVYGLWGLSVLVPRIAAHAPPGASLLAAGLVLALMILPTIALLAEAAMAAVPASQVQAAVALGLGRADTLRAVVLPGASAGLWAAVVLATARALGETMAVLMVAGNVVQVPGSLFAPVRTLAANIALEMSYAEGTHRGALFVSGAVLLAMVAVLSLGASRLGPRHA